MNETNSENLPLTNVFLYLNEKSLRGAKFCFKILEKNTGTFLDFYLIHEELNFFEKKN